MPKINTKEEKLKQSQWSQNCWKHWASFESVDKKDESFLLLAHETSVDFLFWTTFLFFFLFFIFFFTYQLHFSLFGLWIFCNILANLILSFMLFYYHFLDAVNVDNEEEHFPIIFYRLITRKLEFEKCEKSGDRERNLILWYTIFWLYNFSCLDTIKYLNTYMMLVAPRSKKSLDFLRNFNFGRKIEKLAKYV